MFACSECESVQRSRGLIVAQAPIDLLGISSVLTPFLHFIGHDCAFQFKRHYLSLTNMVRDERQNGYGAK